MKIVFIRHTSVNVPPGTCYGQTDVPLANTFGQEAADVCRRLSVYEPFTAVYTSPLSRARKLAVFCGYPDAQPDDRLKEMNMGKWEMQRYDEIQDPALQTWYKDYLHQPATGGESFLQLRARVASFLDDLRNEYPQSSRIAVFAHGGVLVAAALYANLCSESEAFSYLPPYGGIVEILTDVGFN